MFPPYHKYALGSDLRHEAMNVCRRFAGTARMHGVPDSSVRFSHIIPGWSTPCSRWTDAGLWACRTWTGRSA